MVINVTKRKISKRRAIVSSYTWQPPTIFRSRALAPAKYPNSTFQLDPEGLAHCIPATVIDQKG